MHPLPCTYCRRPTHWPRWRKIAHLSYTPLCWPCYAESVLIVTLARQVAQ